MTRSSAEIGLARVSGARELLGGTVRHLHGDVEVWEAMVRGWAAQQASRGLAGSTVEARERIVRQFQRYTNAFPWAWTPADVEEFTATLRGERRVSHSTVRCYQGALRLFVDYVADDRSGWPVLCSERFGLAPTQICHEWNTVVHNSEFEGRPTGRALSRAEVQEFLDHADGEVERRRRVGRKGWVAAFRDATLFKVTYAFGLRRREVAMLDLVDFGRNPHATGFGSFGALQVRYGKAVRGGPPRRRTVLCVMDWLPEVIEEYLDVARPRYAVERQPWLWPTERSERISVAAIDTRFARWRNELGWPAHVGPHALRHSYVTHLIEDGWEPLFVQQQVGHSWASSTAIYTSVGSDYRNRVLQRALAARLPNADARRHEEQGR
jgi:integrase/recombinase XerC